jgi:hypothetical protein
MSARKMRVMPAVEVKGSRAAVLTQVRGTPGPMFVTEGEQPDAESLLCGSCGKALVENVRRGTLVDVFLQCGDCGSVNDVNP